MSPLVRADCKITEVRLSAQEGDPAYRATMLAEVLNVIPEVLEPILFMGTYRIGDVLASENDGESWTYQDTLVDNSNGAVNAFCAAENGWFLAGTGYGVVGGRVWISKDRGDTWTLVQRLGSETLVSCMFAAESGDLFAGTYPSGKIYRSQTNGLSWTQVWDFAGGADEVISVAEAENNNLVAAVNRGGNASQFWLSVDGGDNWTLQQTVDANHSIDCAIIKLNNGWLLTSAWNIPGADPPDVWRSVDNGVTWVNVGDTGDGYSVWGIAEAQNGNVIAVGDEPNGLIAMIWTSTDHGLTWSSFQVPDVPQDYWYASHVVVAENGDVLVALDADHWPLPPHLWRSQDQGVTWAYLLMIPGYYYIDALALLE